MFIRLALVAVSLALAQDAAAPWERDFSDTRLSWKALPALQWRASPLGAAPAATRVLEDAQAGKWSLAGDVAVALAGKWLRVDDAARRARLIKLSVAPDGADVVAKCGVWLPPVPKRDSANFSFEDRAGPQPRLSPVAVLTRYYRVRASEITTAPQRASLADVAWLSVWLDERQAEPFRAAEVRLDPARGLSGRAAAMALAALARENFVALDSPLRDPHLWDVAADWVDERLKRLPRASRRELRLGRDAQGRLEFQLIDLARRGLVSRASISLPRLQERL